MHRDPMRDSHTLAALHAALRFVIADDMPSEHKAVLIEVLTQRLRDQEAAYVRGQAAEQAGGEWQEHEVVQLRTFLQGKIAKGWQHADESLMYLAAQLSRDPRSVRAKATELGLGAGVDFRVAKVVRQAQEE